jgi:RNA polymerase sigma factor (sigma-70 family)
MMDSYLLERFLVGRDDTAFRALVDRHGPMVLGVCAQLLDSRQDAEDAFQATFLTLARRAGTIHRCDSIAPWLHRVAVRVALRSRAKTEKYRTLRPAHPEPADEHGRETLSEHDRQVLREEMDRLPERFRSPLVLCYFEGKTNEEAARQLHCPVGTVKGRLWRAREMLRGRLTGRGLALSDGNC